MLDEWKEEYDSVISFRSSFGVSSHFFHVWEEGIPQLLAAKHSLMIHDRSFYVQRYPGQYIVLHAIENRNICPLVFYCAA